MIIIRKLLSLFLMLVVITSISFTAFAAGEQPSGSNYQYRDYGTHTGYDTFWVAANKNLNYIGQYVYNSSNYLFTLQSLVSDIKLAVDPSSSPAYSTPSGQNYNYYSFSDVLLTSNFWDAINLQMQYVSNRINSINSKLDTIGPSGSNYPKYASGSVSYSDFWDALSNSASSIAYYNNSINNKLPGTGYYAYVDRNGNYISQADSTRPYWSCLVFDLAYIGEDIQTIANRLPSGSTYSGVNGDGTRFQSNYYTAVTDSFRNVGYDVEQLKNFVSDLHYMFASPEDIALKQDQENNISSATSNFLSGSDSSTSVGTGSIGKVKDLGDGVSDFFDPGVSSSNLFTLLSDNSSDGPWMWFTQAVADDLDGVAASNRNKRSSYSEPDVVDFYGAKMDELDNILGGLADD